MKEIRVVLVFLLITGLATASASSQSTWYVDDDAPNDPAPGNPSVSVAPGSQSGTAGSTLSFIVSVTNTDSPECAPGLFKLAGQVPAGWNASLNTDTMSLMPGESGSATWDVTSPVTAAPNSHALQLQVTHGADSTLGASASAVYLIEAAACQAAPPALSVSPANQVGDAGATRDYLVTLVNQDSSTCATSSFELAATLPAGWNSTVLPATLALAPGASGTATVAVTSASEANGDIEDISKAENQQRRFGRSKASSRRISKTAFL